MGETKFKVGISGIERFKFCRDKDTNQVIYPAQSTDNFSVPVRGPDNLDNGKLWKLQARSGDMIRIRLQVVDAHITVRMKNLTRGGGEQVAQSVEGPKRHSYQVKGSFNDWAETDMVADDDWPGIFRYRGVMGPNC